MLLAALTAALAGLPSVPALAGAPSPAKQARLDSTVRYLQDSQQANGGFAKAGEPSQGTTAWVTLALAAAGINPRDQALPCQTSAYDFLLGHFREGFREEIAWPEVATTAFERELLVVDAAGTDPHDFAGYDLVGEILARARPNGSFPYVPSGRGEINDTIFALLALSPIQEPAAQAAVQQGADWLIEQQNGDGGWSWEVKGGASESDMTGAAIEALNAAARPDTEAQQRGFEYLRKAQRPDGGFVELPNSEREANVASTAWAVQAIWSAGQNPETWRTGSGEASEEPLDYMESLQQPDGHIRWRQSSDANGVWMTAYVAPAFAGQALPVPVAERSTGVAHGCSEPGQGGESPQPGGGVIAGGGGKGAPLFSRPKPQSEGRTPGGARVVHNRTDHPTDHSESRRGDNTVQPAGTETSEATSASEAEEGSVVSTAGLGSSDGAGGDGEEGSDGEVTGTLVGSAGGGQLAFGAPGLHGAGAGSDSEGWIAIAIGGAAALAALGGAQRERRRQQVIL